MDSALAVTFLTQILCALIVVAVYRLTTATTTRGHRAGWFTAVLSIAAWLAATFKAEQWGMFLVAVAALVLACVWLQHYHFKALQERAALKKAGLK